MKFIHNLTEQNNILSYNEILNTINNINEEYHEVTNFDNMIKDVAKQIYYSNYTDFYTGWNWFIKEQTCLKVNTEYKSDNTVYKDNIGCPIYIKFDDLENNTYFAVQMRDNTYNIPIYVNKHYNLSIQQYAYKLKHEITHIRTMYSKIDSNPLDSLKNRSSSIELDNIRLINNKQFPFIYNVCYLLSPTEQQARINEYIFFIKDYLKENDIDNVNSHKLINELIEKGYEHTLLKDFFDIYEKLEFMVNAQIYIQVISLGYVLQKYNLFKSNITDTDLMRLESDRVGMIYKYIKSDEDNSYKILEFLKQNLSNYYTKLKNVTYKTLKENNII